MSTETLTKPMQTADENPRLEFREGQFLLKSRNVLGGYIERFISNAAVKEAFSGIPIDSGWLRPEIVRWGNGKVGEWAVAFVPAGVHEIELQSESVQPPIALAPETNALLPGGDVVRLPAEQVRVTVVHGIERIRLPLPGLVFFGLSNQYYIWAVKTPKLEPYQEIYRAPLPNIYITGLVCWGMVKPPRATARTMFEAFDLFMKSTFNNHLSAGRSKKCREDVRVALRDIANAKEDWEPGRSDGHVAYPIHDLVRQVEHTGVTLDAAIRTYFETGEMAE
jgi:hypothetical protein